MGAKELFDLSGKTALVTGGSRGLGLAIVDAFVSCGANVVIASRKRDACEATAARVREAGGRAVALQCHVGQWNDLEEVAERAWNAFDGLDILVNNAGMSLLADSSKMTTEAAFDKVIAVNFKGPFRLTALVGSRMHDGRGGSIINIGSTGSVRPHPTFAPYAGAKAGLNAITKAHALEYAPNVRVNAILPGPFATDVAKSWPKDKEAGLQNALHRFGQPSEIATAALYLASPASAYTTGSLIRVDGGRE
jgi:NAD(P)-dependent dehydrogenase (short-subunit alcohol dehydrogenase family)